MPPAVLLMRFKRGAKPEGPTVFACTGRAKFQTEDYYIAQKLMKGCLGTNNFDADSPSVYVFAGGGLYAESGVGMVPPACLRTI